MFLYNRKRFRILCVSTLVSLLFGVDNVSRRHYSTKILILSLHCNKNCIYFIISFSKSSSFHFIAMVVPTLLIRSLLRLVWGLRLQQLVRCPCGGLSFCVSLWTDRSPPHKHQWRHSEIQMQRGRFRWWDKKSCLILTSLPAQTAFSLSLIHIWRCRRRRECRSRWSPYH